MRPCEEKAPKPRSTRRRRQRGDKAPMNQPTQVNRRHLFLASLCPAVLFFFFPPLFLWTTFLLSYFLYAISLAEQLKVDATAIYKLTTARKQLKLIPTLEESNKLIDLVRPGKNVISLSCSWNTSSLLMMNYLELPPVEFDQQIPSSDFTHMSSPWVARRFVPNYCIEWQFFNLSHRFEARNSGVYSFRKTTTPLDQPINLQKSILWESSSIIQTGCVCNVKILSLHGRSSLPSRVYYVHSVFEAPSFH